MSDTDTTFPSLRPSELAAANDEDYALNHSDPDRSASPCTRSSARTIGYARSHSSPTGDRHRTESVSSQVGVTDSWSSGCTADNCSSLSSRPDSLGPSRLELCNRVLEAVQTATGGDRGTIDPNVPVSVTSGTFDGPDRRVELVFRVKVPASSVLGLLNQHADDVFHVLLANSKLR